jgi:hypothetical protein
MTETEYRTAWRAALADLLAKAEVNLPLSSNRLKLAARLALKGDVTFNPDGSATVGSLTDPAKTYRVEHGVCPCKDYTQAPGNLCKHRLAVAMVHRVNALVPEPVRPDDVLDRPLPATSDQTPLPANDTPLAVLRDVAARWDKDDDADAPQLGQRIRDALARGEHASPPAGPLPEAPVSATAKGFKNGQEMMVTIRGYDFDAVKPQIEAALQWLDARKEVTAPPVEMCEQHNVPYNRHEKNGDVWWSHPLAGGGHHRRPDPQRGNSQRRGSRQQRGPR